MYYPYFRGKQFELIAIRESADLLKASGFVPIIEPVRESLGGLSKALGALTDAETQAVVIINPQHGDHKQNGATIGALLEHDYRESAAIRPGILLTNKISTCKALRLIDNYRSVGATLIHSGFTDSRALGV